MNEPLFPRARLTAEAQLQHAADALLREESRWREGWMALGFTIALAVQVGISGPVSAATATATPTPKVLSPVRPTSPEAHPPAKVYGLPRSRPPQSKNPAVKKTPSPRPKPPSKPEY